MQRVAAMLERPTAANKACYGPRTSASGVSGGCRMWSKVKPWVRPLLWTIAYVGSCAVFIGLRDDALFLAVIALMAVLGSARRLLEAMRRSLSASGLSRAGRVARVVAVMVVGGALITYAVTFGTDGWLFFGITVLLLGLGLITEQLRAADFARDRAWWLVGFVVGALSIGVFGAVLDGSKPFTWLLVAAVFFVPLAVGLAAERVLNPAPPAAGAGAPPVTTTNTVPWWWPAVGLALAGGIVLGALSKGADASYVLPIALGLFLVVAGMAARSNADIVVVIMVAAVVWTLTYQAAPIPPNLQPAKGDGVIVALGDSYISGEGADVFYEGTNDKNDADAKECRRAPTAYSPLLMADRLPGGLPNELVFLACSGAKIGEVRDEQLPQLAALMADDGLDLEPKLVLLSVGGNDSLFGTIGRVCILPTDCTDLGRAWRENLPTVATALRELYPMVREVVGDDVPVVVVPYPIPLAETRCRYSALTTEEHRFLHGFTEQLDQVVAEAATDEDFWVVDTVPDALTGRRICDVRDPADAAVNFLAANSVLGTLEQSLSPTNWFHNSLHPNASGHEILRGRILEWLVEHEQDLGGDPPDTSPLAGRAIREVDVGDECEGKQTKNLDDCSWEWAASSMGGFLTWWYPGLLVAVAGMFLIAVWAVSLWRRHT